MTLALGIFCFYGVLAIFILYGRTRRLFERMFISIIDDKILDKHKSHSGVHKTNF